MPKTQVVAGLEIARAKVRMVAGEAADNGFGLLGASEIYCPDGIKNGTVINLDKMTEAIVVLLEEINRKINQKIGSVYVNVSGSNVRQEIVSSVITLPQRGCEITKRNIDTLLESCRIVSVPLDRHLLYIFPLEYIVDGQDGIKDPVGLCGSRLEAKILIITAPFNHVQNIIKAVNYSGLETEEVVLTPLANAASALTNEEKREGALLIDFKTDLTEMAVFSGCSLVYFESLPRGQDSATQKLAEHFDIPFDVTQELKVKYGFFDSVQGSARNQETIPLEWMGTRRNITRSDLNLVLREETNSMFEMVSERLKKIKNINNIIRKGAVVTGGMASMEGFIEAMSQSFGFIIRPGVPGRGTEHLGGDYTVPAGLAFLAFDNRRKNRLKPEANFFRKMYQKADKMLTEYF